MVGEDGLSEVCVPLHAPGFALNIACHAHFRDGVFGAQHVRDVAKGGRKQGDLACPPLLAGKNSRTFENRLDWQDFTNHTGKNSRTFENRPLLAGKNYLTFENRLDWQDFTNHTALSYRFK